ncbi:hypothetical protein GLOIN_2v1867267 [Rhizophagus irregularis DAOM 181602=DAOM 197198]|nr:hypothetical protein GLOIN_2v1867267 [Rhizophagus irregularis DAOM 181602=DAOM 197198]
MFGFIVAYDDSNDVMILSNENDHVLLCSEKRFRSWEECEEFTEDGESDLDELDDINHQEDETSNKENIDPLVLILRNPKKRYSKGRPLENVGKLAIIKRIAR